MLASEQWSAFIGFFPGLPFMFPLDPRETVFVPKYNPTRTWTPEGAVGIGGPCFAIYPVESAGGYQLVGRTLPVYDLAARNAVFRENPLLLRPGDRVKFHRIEEDELLQLFEDVRADRYRYEIEDSPFDVGAFLDWLPTIREEAEAALAGAKVGFVDMIRMKLLKLPYARIVVQHSANDKWSVTLWAWGACGT